MEKAFPYAIAALFALCAINALSALGGYTIWERLLPFAGYAVAIVSLILSARNKKRNVIAVIGLGLLALSCTSPRLLQSYPLLFEFLAWGSAALICLFMGKNEKFDKKIWFVPAILLLAKDIIFAVSQDYLGTSLLQMLIKLLALLGIMRWEYSLNGKITFRSRKISAHHETYNHTEECYYDMAKHVLLLLFTCGVWMYMWIYKTTEHTNTVKGEEYRNPTNKLLLCLFVPFYSVYWTYKTAQRIDKMANEKGISSDVSTLCLVLAIFVPIIPPILLQDKLNGIATANTSHVNKSKGASELGVADELKKYKELLDSGVISQEEFDAKKKQLLGL